ncbi:biotin-independent malonate decarboxylase subunit beta [Pseudalkalibacillus salsuginis]|uniref:biotin-independent malonate decarboxylase subunit beta n=1 Tax=Pseudalkalibacillus salsuginis TaxID=2910972 RepID=UPI001F3DDC79|nr:biotin-independent malonate decarboxylase subunit beta [Pseudalkalibacillus salsuginis]MCF6409606.1 biotin-independent malonate decarboxylase subunit beta [Pseudalkalibacillus salsuginis]
MTLNNLKTSLVELDARSRAKAILDEGTFRELLGPFEQLESPHLAAQGIVPQSDDGVVVAKGYIKGEPAVIISIEGDFQGGGIGEVSGAKIAGALELALRDNKNGIPVRPILIFDTGGVRLQEANYGLLAIAEIGSAIIELRNYTPVVGLIPGKIGSFGGMSITAGLFSKLIMTREARLALNGPEVIEQEAGLEEFDSQNRQQVWQTIGGEQRVVTGLADMLVEDDIPSMKEAIHAVFDKPETEKPRSTQVARYQTLLKATDPSYKMQPIEMRELWKQIAEGKPVQQTSAFHEPKNGETSYSRGQRWFEALAGTSSKHAEVQSILWTDKGIGGDRARFIAVIPNPNSRFPRARNGEVGLEEGWAIAECVREAVEEDRHGEKRAIVAIVDVPSQAYGYREELLGIHLSCAAAVDAYATARQAGHPVISLIVGKAISGAFLAHGMQANRILALNDEAVNVHVMSKQSAARITRRSIEELEKATEKVPAMAYDIHSFATLGALFGIIDGVDANTPTKEDSDNVMERIHEAIRDVKSGSTGLEHRFTQNDGRRASILVRKRLEEQW